MSGDASFSYADISAVDVDMADTLFTPADPSPDVMDDGTYDEPSLTFVKPPPKPHKAAEYQKKAQAFFQVLFRATVDNSATVPDAAAIIMHGPAISEKAGRLAAHDERIARGIDFLTEGSENPYAALAIASAPLLMQVIRNHEPVLAPVHRGIRVPFTQRRLKLKLGVKLGRLRTLTNDPGALYRHVFNNADIRASLLKQNITVAPLRQRTRDTQSTD